MTPMTTMMATKEETVMDMIEATALADQAPALTTRVQSRTISRGTITCSRKETERHQDRGQDHLTSSSAISMSRMKRALHQLSNLYQNPQRTLAQTFTS